MSGNVLTFIYLEFRRIPRGRYHYLMFPLEIRKQKGQATETNFYKAISLQRAFVYLIWLTLFNSLNSYDLVFTDEESKLQRLHNKPETELDREGQIPWRPSPKPIILLSRLKTEGLWQVLWMIMGWDKDGDDDDNDWCLQGSERYLYFNVLRVGWKFGSFPSFLFSPAVVQISEYRIANW